MKKICVIHPYFGKLPALFQHWLLSCKMNPTVDFYIFTDSDDLQSCDNIFVYHMAFEEFRQEVQNEFENLFGFKPVISKPYKLCDYKILYGILLKARLKNDYDFWGFSDSDMIFGDIRKFVTDELLETKRHFYSLGHFQLQAYDDPDYLIALNKIESKGCSFEGIYSSDAIFQADELPCGLPAVYYNYYKESFYNELENDYRAIYDEITPNFVRYIDLYNDSKTLGIHYNEHFYGLSSDNLPYLKKSVRADLPKRKYLCFYYEDGKLFRAYLENNIIRKEEILYIHLYKRSLQFPDEITSRYCIGVNKIYNIDSFEDVNPKSIAAGPRLELPVFYFKRRVRKILKRLGI